MLNTNQLDQLLKPLDPSRVQKDNKGMSHLAAWDVRRWLNRIFGIGGWDNEIIILKCVYEKETKTKAGRPAWNVGYRATTRLRIKDPERRILAEYEDGAFGSSTIPDLGDAHDMAMKTALSQSLKRCAMNLGDQFGLSLYNNGSTSAVVGRMLSIEVEEQPAQEAVEGDTETAVEVSTTEGLVDMDAVAALCERMDAAESLPDLQVVAQEIAGLTAKGSLTQKDKDLLGTVWKERKAALS